MALQGWLRNQNQNQNLLSSIHHTLCAVWWAAVVVVAFTVVSGAALHPFVGRPPLFNLHEKYTPDRKPVVCKLTETSYLVLPSNSSHTRPYMPVLEKKEDDEQKGSQSKVSWIVSTTNARCSNQIQPH